MVNNQLLVYIFLLSAVVVIFLTHCYRCSTFVECSLQIQLFMQNKANLQKSETNVTSYQTNHYKYNQHGRDRKNKAKTNPIYYPQEFKYAKQAVSCQ